MAKVKIYVLFDVDLPTKEAEYLEKAFGEEDNMLSYFNPKDHPFLLPALGRGGYLPFPLMVRVVPNEPMEQ